MIVPPASSDAERMRVMPELATARQAGAVDEAHAGSHSSIRVSQSIGARWSVSRYVDQRAGAQLARELDVTRNESHGGVIASRLRASAKNPKTSSGVPVRRCSRRRVWCPNTVRSTYRRAHGDHCGGPGRGRGGAVGRPRAGRARLHGHRLREALGARRQGAQLPGAGLGDRRPRSGCRPSTASASSRASTATCRTRWPGSRPARAARSTACAAPIASSSPRPAARPSCSRPRTSRRRCPTSRCWRGSRTRRPPRSASRPATSRSSSTGCWRC